jgi:hypothetical protein
MSLPIVRCANLGDVLERIRHDHQPDQWLYRGQIHRRPVHRMVVDGQNIDLENLYPGSFRFAAKHEIASEAFYGEWQNEHTKADALFHQFTLMMLARYEAGRQTAGERFAWLDPYHGELRQLLDAPGRSLFSGFHQEGMGLRNPGFVRIAWALAQHYEVITALLDFTYEPGIAAWFATNEWNAPPQPRALDGEGVIYRIDAAGLRAGTAAFNLVFQSRTNANPYQPPPDQTFVQDLRGIPAAFASRPQRQQGAVAWAFADPRFLQVLYGTDMVKAFVFPHVAHETSRWPLGFEREHLKPTNDPFEDLIREFQRDWAPHAAAREAVRYTKPVAIVTPDTEKLASASPFDPDDMDAVAREAMYDAYTRDLAADRFETAAGGFERILTMRNPHGADRVSVSTRVNLASARLSLNQPEAAFEAHKQALAELESMANAPWAADALHAIVEGGAQLARKGYRQPAQVLFKAVLKITEQWQPSEATDEVTARATYLAGLIELQDGAAQSGLARLREAVARFADGTDYQRLFAAAALFDTGTFFDKQPETRDVARADFEELIARFGQDSSPEIRNFVDRARRKLAAS